MELSKDSKITLCNDGKYRWIYELDMLKNPVIFGTVAVVLFIGLCFPLLLTTIMSLIDGNFSFENLKVFGILYLVLLAIGYVSYLIVAKVYSFKYIVVFEMDEDGINHIQEDSQAEKGQILASIAALAGAATKNPTLAGTGLLAASKTSLYSTFKNVKRVIPKRKLNCIKVNETFFKNQIYCEDQDFDFVYNYIKERCNK